MIAGAPGRDKSDRAFVAAALAGHAVLLVALSLAWGPQAPRAWPIPQPMAVSLVTDVAPDATAPPSPEPPAPSIAPEAGTPQEAPPPAPVPQPAAKPAPARPAPAPPQPVVQPKPSTAPAKPVAQPKPAVTVARPQPVKPQPAAARSAPARPASRLAGLGKELAAGAKADAAPARQRGRRLGDNFLAGLAPDAPATRASAAAPGAKAGPYPTASIQQAIARQIQPCADRQVNPGPGANRIVTTLNLRLNPDGTLAATPRMVRQSGVDGENERYVQRVVDLGVAAFKGCTPLKLPAEYYQTGNGGWSNINYQWKLR